MFVYNNNTASLHCYLTFVVGFYIFSLSTRISCRSGQTVTEVQGQYQNSMSDVKETIQKQWRDVCLYDDKKAFELLFFQLNRSLINFCKSYVHHEYVAEELVSDIFVTCWLKRKTLLPVKDPRKYLYTAVKNRALNYLRDFSTLHIVPISEQEDQLIDTGDPNRELERKEFFIKIDQIIRRLPQQTFQVFQMIKEDGLSYQEAAAILKISPRTIQTHMRRAIKKISRSLEDYREANKKMLENTLLSLSLVSAIQAHYLFF